jgi:single-strand DNA-binding protein
LTRQAKSKKLAGLVNRYVKKGALVQVIGRLSLRSYTDKQQMERTAVEILANDVIFLTPKAKETTDGLEQAREPQE